MAKEGSPEGKGRGSFPRVEVSLRRVPLSLPNHVRHLPSFPLRGRKSTGLVHRVFRKRNAILERASAKAEKCRNIPRNAVQLEPPGFALMGLGDSVSFNWDLSHKTPPLSFK